MLETHKRMEGYAELTERKNDLLREIKARQFEEANRCVSERDVERYPDGQSYGESQLESNDTDATHADAPIRSNPSPAA